MQKYCIYKYFRLNNYSYWWLEVAHERYFDRTLGRLELFIEASQGADYANNAFRESFAATYVNACEQAPAVAEKYREFAASIGCKHESASS